MESPKNSELLEKVPDNYLMIKFGYSGKYIFPYDVGIKVLELFKQAEAVVNGYSDMRIVPISNSESVEMIVVSKQNYLAGKLSNILGVQIEPEAMGELEVIQREPNENTNDTIDS